MIQTLTGNLKTTNNMFNPNNCKSLSHYSNLIVFGNCWHCKVAFKEDEEHDCKAFNDPDGHCEHESHKEYA